ncbi:MAG: MFS transporter, partial [Porticoccaceae bacterium]|nr:MFS transporter [Porticoccaceae bacterium]
AMILGPWISSLFDGLPAVFWVTALLGTLGLVWAQWRLPAPRSAVAVHREAINREAINRETINRETQAVPAMISGVLKDIRLLRLDLGIFTLHLILMAAFVAIPRVLTDGLQLPLESHWWVYLLLLGGSFFAMIPAIIAAERGGRMKPVFLGAIALAALSLGGFSLGFERGAVVALSLLFLFFMAFNLLEASLPSLVSKTAPAGTRGTAMGVYSTSQFLGAFVGGVLGGWLLPLYGVAGLFAVLALLAALWLLLVFSMEAPRALSGVVLQYRDHD